jgi:predicted O-methyltransferase YrrM
MRLMLALPKFTRWSIPDDAMEIIHGLIVEARPHLVLECGSGRSTPQIAAWVEEFDGRVLSLDHEVDFALSTGRYVHDNGLAELCDVRWAELVPHEAADCLADVWYDRAGWAHLQRIDVLLVDGPPGHTAPYARDPAFPLLQTRLSPSALVIVDDTNRQEEQDILAHWQQLEPGLERTHAQHSTGQISWGRMP